MQELFSSMTKWLFEGNMVKTAYLLILALITVSCGASMSSQLIKKDARLAKFQKLYFMIETAGSAVSISEATVGSVIAKGSQTAVGCYSGRYWDISIDNSSDVGE